LSTCHPEVAKEIATQTEQEKGDKRKRQDENMLKFFTNKCLMNESLPVDSTKMIGKKLNKN